MRNLNNFSPSLPDQNIQYKGNNFLHMYTQEQVDRRRVMEQKTGDHLM